MRKGNRSGKPQIRPQEDLPEIEVEDVITPIVRWPTEENPLAGIINDRVQHLWRINGSALETNAAIEELMAKLGSFKRIKYD
jgi:hypothetical protein